MEFSCVTTSRAKTSRHHFCDVWRDATKMECLFAMSQFWKGFSGLFTLPDGGGDTTKSPKLTESFSSSRRKVAEFHTKLYLSLTCSKRDFLGVGRLFLTGNFRLINECLDVLMELNQIIYTLENTIFSV